MDRTLKYARYTDRGTDFQVFRDGKAELVTPVNILPGTLSVLLFNIFGIVMNPGDFYLFDDNRVYSSPSELEGLPTRVSRDGEEGRFFLPAPDAEGKRLYPIGEDSFYRFLSHEETGPEFSYLVDIKAIKEAARRMIREYDCRPNEEDDCDFQDLVDSLFNRYKSVRVYIGPKDSARLDAREDVVELLMASFPGTYGTPWFIYRGPVNVGRVHLFYYIFDSHVIPND